MAASSEIFLLKCAKFRDEGQFIDVRLKVNDEVFTAHRIVLAASSDYFYAMFTNGMKESNQEMIELKDESITSNALKIILDSIYTEDLHVTEENVFDVLAAAFHLQVTSVVQQEGICSAPTGLAELPSALHGCRQTRYERSARGGGEQDGIKV